MEIVSERKGVLSFSFVCLMVLLLRCLDCMKLCVWGGGHINLYLYHRRDECSHGDISGVIPVLFYVFRFFYDLYLSVMISFSCYIRYPDFSISFFL